jgi:hypothetical protein
MPHEDLEILCKRCGQVVRHRCNVLLRQELRDLLRLRPEPDAPLGAAFNRQNPYYSEGCEKAPIFSEVFLYTLLGKETARSILYRLNAVIEACGINIDQLHQEADSVTNEALTVEKWCEMVWFRSQEQEMSGQFITVLLAPALVEKLDEAVAEASKTPRLGRASRSSILQTLIRENLK